MTTDYARIETAIRFIGEHARKQPSLDDVARAVGVSPAHVQRLFQRWAGVSPKRFLQTLTVEHAKGLLAQSTNVLETTYAVGLSGPGRLHDHFVALEAMTPGEYKDGGAGLSIQYGVHASPFGSMLVAVTERGVCHLAFIEDDARKEERDRLLRTWPQAELMEDAPATRALAERIFTDAQDDQPLPVLVKGTNFQVAVWRALLRIPSGHLCAYEQVARAIDRPTAARAVGAAVGANPTAYLIPCHRVIRSVGELGGYRWGVTRKRALIGWESVRDDRRSQPTPERPPARPRADGRRR